MIYATIGIVLLLALVVATFVWGVQHAGDDRLDPSADFRRPPDQDDLPTE